MYFRIGSVFTLLVVLLGCSGDDEMLKVKRDIANLQEQIYEIERSQVELKGDVVDKSQALERRLSDRSDLANAEEELQSLKDRVSRYEALIFDLEAKVGELQRAGTSVQLQTTENPGGTGPIESNQTQAVPLVSGDVVEQQFNQALLDYNRGKFKVAVIGFQDILNNFQNSPYAEASHYYLGVSHFQLKEYPKARNHFSQITTQYSRGDFIKQAMYYEGQCYFFLNQPSKAILTLRDLIERYPGTQESSLAQQFLKKTGYER